MNYRQVKLFKSIHNEYILFYEVLRYPKNAIPNAKSVNINAPLNIPFRVALLLAFGDEVAVLEGVPCNV